MLTVQPVKLSQQLPFRSERTDEGYRYSKTQYQNDKTSLENQLEDLNSVIENTDVPKPIRAFGKVISIGIGAALGFVSMKYGVQGMTKLVKSGAKKASELFQSPKAAAIGEKFSGIGKSIKDGATRLYNKIIESKFVKKIAEFFVGLGEKYKNSKFGKKMAKWGQAISDLKPVKTVKEKATKVKDNVVETVKGVTGEKVEKGIENIFAVSGGVSGGVTALQEVTEDN